MNDIYAAVLTDLHERKSRLERELAQVEAGITAIQGLTVVASVQPVTVGRISGSPTTPLVLREYARRYAGISVRWGVLSRLAEVAQSSPTGFERTGDIAKAILDGGYKSKEGTRSRFGNMVSAVLHGMKTKEPAEVESDNDGGYRITEHGRKVWEMIEQSPKYRDRFNASSEPTLLSVQ